MPLEHRRDELIVESSLSQEQIRRILAAQPDGDGSDGDAPLTSYPHLPAVYSAITVEIPGGQGGVFLLTCGHVRQARAANFWAFTYWAHVPIPCSLCDVRVPA